MRARLLWTIYCVAVLGIGIGRTVEKMMRDSGGIQGRYGPAAGAIVVVVLTLVARRSRAVGPRAVWGAAFALLVLGGLGLLALTVITLMSGSAPPRVHALLLGGALLCVPAQVAVYRYSLGRSHAWRGAGARRRDR